MNKPEISTHLSLLDWLREREANARRLAVITQDKDGWLEDAAYFKAAAECVWDNAALQADQSSDSAVKLAELILSDCGQSTAITTALRDRVALRIDKYTDAIAESRDSMKKATE